MGEPTFHAEKNCMLQAGCSTQNQTISLSTTPSLSSLLLTLSLLLPVSTSCHPSLLLYSSLSLPPSPSLPLSLKQWHETPSPLRWDKGTRPNVTVSLLMYKIYRQHYCHNWKETIVLGHEVISAWVNASSLWGNSASNYFMVHHSKLTIHVKPHLAAGFVTAPLLMEMSWI